MEYTTLLLYLLSSTWTHSCNFPHTSGRITVCQRLEKLGLWSTSQFESGGVKSAPGDQSCLSVDCFLRLSLLLSSLYIKHYDLILPFICSYMWDLISRAHIWCAFGFVLETGCYIGPSRVSDMAISKNCSARNQGMECTPSEIFYLP